MGKFGCKGLLLLGSMIMLGGGGTSSIFTFFIFYGRYECSFAIKSGSTAH